MLNKIYKEIILIMASIEQEELIQYLATNPFRNITDFYFFYKEYSKHKVYSIATFKNSPKTLNTFLHKNKKHIFDCDPARIDRLIDNATEYLEGCVSDALNGPHARYVDIVKGFFDTKDHILDVGAGEMAGSSILLAKTYNQVSSMDDCFRISDTSLKKMGVEPHNKYFTEFTDISRFDAVVGRHPCSAIIDMVRSSAKAGKPYIIELCECEMPTFYDLVSLDLPEINRIDVSPLLKRVVYDKQQDRISAHFNWSDILPLYDSNVKIVGGFATNLDLSNESFVRHLAKYGISSKPRPIFDESDFRDMHNDKSSIVNGELNIAVDHSDTESVRVVRYGELNGSKFWRVEKDNIM